MAQERTPSTFLSEIVGKPVIVRLNSGIDYRGKWLLAGIGVDIERD
jgi:small nuclear ribonucleoprotein (snRNP)-like protein